MRPHSPFLEVVATLTSALGPFLDAVKLQVAELGKRWLAPALILGPGTALIVVAVLASTDPVVLWEIVRD